MTRKTPPSRRAAATRPSIAPAWTNDVAGQQFAVVAEGGAVLLRGLAAMHNIQEASVRHTTERHTAAAAGLHASSSAGERLAVQAELLRGDVEEATRCWQQLMDEALEIQSELLACATHLVNTEDMFAAARLLHA
ncbi:MAG: phasin family protein [Ramlibacter sp.]